MEPDPDEHQHPGEEDLSWQDETVKGKKPKGLYSKTTETARGFISTEKQCALFCGGKKCKYCSSEGWSDEECVIKGLYSHWITDNILAMARPSNFAIQKFNIVQQFKDAGINSVVNLQKQGEHAECGPEKLDESGFSYSPQKFMDNGIFYYNFGWPDYGVASLSTILDMVKVMQFAVSEGKVAVHCHAGRGRTGVIIACYLVFTNRISGIDAIHYVRDKRPNSIQTRAQMQAIQEFEQYLKPFRTVFASRQAGSHEFSLHQFLNRQRHILHGYEERRLKYVPKIIYVVCERLLELAKLGSSLQKQVNKSMASIPKTYHSHTTVNHKDTDNGHTVAKSASKDSLFLASGKKKRYKASLLATRTRLQSISMEDLNDEKFKEVLDEQDKVSVCSSNSGVVSRASEQSDEEDDDASIVFGNSTLNLQAAAKDDKVNGEVGQGHSNDKKFNGAGTAKKLLDNVSLQSDMTTWSIDQSITGQLSEECVHAVANALSAKDVQDYVLERAVEYENQLNDNDTSWMALTSEGDPHVLAQILWDWLDQLKEPILRAQDLGILLQHVENPELGLHKVEKGTKSTIEYLIKVVSKLSPMNDDTLVNIYEKLLCHLTHQWVVFDNIDLTKSWAGSTISSMAEEKDHWSEMRPDIGERLFQLFNNIQTDLQKKSSSKLVS